VYAYEEARVDHADVAGGMALAGVRGGRCPFHDNSPDPLDEWVDRGLYCSAGKREFKLGRYHVARVKNGVEYRQALEAFRCGVAEHRKTGFLALLSYDEQACMTVEDELRRLGEAMEEAGVADNASSLIQGETLVTPVETFCPVTGEMTVYEFFSVAFCRHANSPADKLYDPSLSAPFTAINTTSDAFAFAMLTRDQAMRVFGKPPHEIGDRDALELLFRKCVTIWQNMSINTIQTYGRMAVDPARGVHFSEDRRRWIAPHNDPVFGELEKCPHFHEMPISYATRLSAKWSAMLFDGKEYVPSRDGQAGGIPLLLLEDSSDELHRF
jgi:hypothetical protein